MKTPRSFWLLSGAPLFLTPFCGGCQFQKAPEALPIPTPVPAPKPPFFDPAAGQSPGKRLNTPGDPIAPDAFRIPKDVGVISGDTIALQSVKTVKVGTPPKDVVTLGAPETVKLAGIIAPATGQGLQLARNAITAWGVGPDLDVDQDPKFPVDLNGVKMVQVYFKGRKGLNEGTVLSLNRMLVRSGNAVVDLYSPTSFDTSQWLLDESYARIHQLGFWKLGLTVQQRVPVLLPAKAGQKRSGSNVTIMPNGTTKARVTGALANGAAASGVVSNSALPNPTPLPSVPSTASGAVNQSGAAPNTAAPVAAAPVAGAAGAAGQPGGGGQ